MKGYIGIWKGRRFEVYADSSYEAQKKIAQENRIKKTYEISVFLAEKNGETVTRNGSEL